MKKKNNLFSKLNFILGTRYKTYYLIYIFCKSSIDRAIYV